MFAEDELIPLSALQHFLFCERQCALIHLEQVWEENRFTAEGNVLHERVHDEHRERRKLSRTEYSLALRSLTLGVVGVADVVEFTLKPEGGYLEVIPVEYKRGKDKETDVDRVQLCAQALCLEEMFSVSVPTGSFYYLQDHRRTKVEFDSDLRAKTSEVVEATHRLFSSLRTPAARYEKAKCDRCSLVERCMPKALNNSEGSVGDYIRGQLQRGRSHA